MVLKENISKLEKVISEELKREFAAQGHTMNGKLINDIEWVVKEETNMFTLSGFMYPYGNILAAGTKSSKIPFSGRSGRGGTSKYIQALQDYAKERMNISGEKESLSVAFAIAHKQKKEGMPTRGSYAFSKSGKRLDWVEEALKHGEDKILEVIRELYYNVVSVNLDAIIAKWQIELNKSA